jgi:adenylate cyclase
MTISLFSWKQQLLEKKEMAEITKETNKILVHNILPVHVADIYLSRQYRNDLYSEEYDEVAVMFATIMNFEASTGSIESEQRVLKSLNEIICAFDEKLMTFSGYQKVEKIKIAGWTYMAACGLDPGRGDSTGSNKGLIDGRRSFNTNLACNKSIPERRKAAKTSLRQSKNVVIILAEFALELMRVLQRISAENENYKNRAPLKLRVGISHGKVMAGVIGSSKPLYDIWGNSVNMASRMDSTGISGQIQVGVIIIRLFKIVNFCR